MSTFPLKAKYLGDGFYYVWLSNGSLRLFCYDGIKIYEDIHLEPEICMELMAILQKEYT